MRDVSIKRALALSIALLSLAVLPASAGATATQSEIDDAIEKAVAYATSQQDPGTGEPPGYEHSGFYSGEWLASGYAAAGLSSADVGTAGNPSLQDFILAEDAGFWSFPGLIAPENAARLILTARAAGIDTARVSAAQNLPAELVGDWKPLSGGFAEPNTFSTAWGTLALRTTPLPSWASSPALSYLRTDQHADGGWSFYPVDAGEESDADITAAAVGALCAGGAPAYDPAVIDGLAYLRGLQVKETGAIESPAFGVNIDTTAFAVNALDECGIDPQSAAWTSDDGKTPIDHILSLQLGDGGFAWATGEPWFPPSTGHALRALSAAGFRPAPPARQDPSLPSIRPVPTVATGTPVPHVLAIELAPGNVRLCSATAPVGASLADLLTAAQASSSPPGCVSSFVLSGDKVAAIDGVSAENEDESWLLRLDRGAAALAGQQAVGFGDVVSLRIGATPAAGKVEAGAPGPAGPPGPQGRRGKRGRKGKPGRNATIACKAKRHRSGKRVVRCTVREAQSEQHRAG